ncbi:MAG: hypothetical protein ACFFG0_07880 [Candidatus Thorarchaeota archaeon]
MEENLPALWNFDGGELVLLFKIKTECAEHLDSWKLNDAYWSLRSLRREIDAKLNREKKEKYNMLNDQGKLEERELTEKEYTDIFLEGIDGLRETLMGDSEDEAANENKTKFYHALEGFYMYLCFLMKKHKLYFREGENPEEAYRRR